MDINCDVSRRIIQEIDGLNADPIPGVMIVPLQGHPRDFFVFLAGPPSSLYVGRLFKLLLSFPFQYPDTKPNLVFVNTEISHPKVIGSTIDVNSLLKRGSWNPACKIKPLLKVVVELLSNASNLLEGKEVESKGLGEFDSEEMRGILDCVKKRAIGKSLKLVHTLNCRLPPRSGTLFLHQRFVCGEKKVGAFDLFGNGMVFGGIEHSMSISGAQVIEEPSFKFSVTSPDSKLQLKLRAKSVAEYHLWIKLLLGVSRWKTTPQDESILGDDDMAPSIVHQTSHENPQHQPSSKLKSKPLKEPKRESQMGLFHFREAVKKSQNHTRHTRSHSHGAPVQVKEAKPQDLGIVVKLVSVEGLKISGETELSATTSVGGMSKRFPEMFWNERDKDTQILYWSKPDTITMRYTDKRDVVKVEILSDSSDLFDFETLGSISFQINEALEEPSWRKFPLKNHGNANILISTIKLPPGSLPFPKKKKTQNWGNHGNLSNQNHGVGAAGGGFWDGFAAAFSADINFDL